MARREPGCGPPRARRRPRARQPHLHPPGARRAGRIPGGRRDRPLSRRARALRGWARAVVPAVRHRGPDPTDVDRSRPRRLSDGRRLRRGPARLPGPGRAAGRGSGASGIAPGRDRQPPHRPRGDGRRASHHPRRGRGIGTAHGHGPSAPRPMRAPSDRARMVVSVLALVLAACGHHAEPRAAVRARPHPSTTQVATRAEPSGNVYASTGVGQLSPAVAGVPARVYVPNSEAGTVDVIDPVSFRIIDHFAVGHLPQHVTPAWDLRTLYVDNDLGNSLTPIDPRTGRAGAPIPVEDPYNLYFTPDGTRAIVVAERLHRLDFRDPHTWQLIR